ncbi:response regulator [Massilia psychrophila]|uniref:response regulator n=1 Tax=Massilia psychrophila TaxID=1603353 RepID=UPI0019C6C2B1|nr:response regulator [Massilia psychrophila]GGE85978.1 hypothetical protein GCM10008020_33540 [Massilia psychrophila]
MSAMGAIEQVDWAAKSYLVVDDFVGIRQLLRESLRNLAAKNIGQASSGGEAIALLAHIRYDVVLCDYNLGEGKNGQQVLEEARMRNYLLPSSVWMMVSAEKSVESVIGAAERQPDAYSRSPKAWSTTKAATSGVRARPATSWRNCLTRTPRARTRQPAWRWRPCCWRSA